jgi:hypothetical protein
MRFAVVDSTFVHLSNFHALGRIITGFGPNLRNDRVPIGYHICSMSVCLLRASDWYQTGVRSMAPALPCQGLEAAEAQRNYRIEAWPILPGSIRSRRYCPANSENGWGDAMPSSRVSVRGGA